MNVTGAAFTLYPVHHLARAREFYERVLGLTPARSFGDSTHGRVEYTLGVHKLVIDTAAARPPSAGGGAVVLEVDDFDAALERLGRAGVAFVSDPNDWSIRRTAALSDPDGNTVCLCPREPDLTGPAVVHQ
jgi:catechol 2,3-dioxygenase-like lactoylglutathione lyase family enzyme